MDNAGGLLLAINELYRTVDAYPRPKSFTGCGCCWSGGESYDDGSGVAGSTIHKPAPGENRPLRELDVVELREVAPNVPHLGGDVNVLRHYLPRLLEIVVTTGFNWPDFEPLIARLNHGAQQTSTPWWTWPKPD